MSQYSMDSRRDDVRRRSREYDGPGRTVRPGNKRLIIACDGTWQDSTAGLNDGKMEPPTNVTRICRAIKTISASGVPQIVYYQAGPGTSTTILGPVDKIVGGAVGSGVAQNVRESFSFLANNYSPGDEIFFIGFSRGAFTARSIASMVTGIGVLTKKGLEAFPVIYKDYQNRYEKDYVSPQADVPFPNKPRACDPEYIEELYARGMTIPNVPIKAIGVWETVGSLGVPKIRWLEKLGIQSGKMHEMEFYDTSLSPSVEYAFQALALDERRASFSPAVWELPKGSGTKLRQTWMIGSHSNVGGGYDDANLANIALAWMLSNLSHLLDFDDDYIIGEFEKNEKYYRKRKLKHRGWGFGKVYDSNDGIYSLGGSTTRTPGDYTRCDPSTGEATSKLLRRTNETVHVSVRTRLNLRGYGTDDEGHYDPKPMRSFKSRWDDEAGCYKWVDKKEGIELFEAELGPVERKLLECSPALYEYVFEQDDKAHAQYLNDTRRDPVAHITNGVERL